MRVKNMETKMKQYLTFFEQSHEDSFQLKEGKGVVMISAPHSVEQTRKGAVKYAEPQTGILALLLHDELNCPVIYKTKNDNDDANFDVKSPYKEALVKYIKENKILFLLDLHQLAPRRKASVNFGIANFRNMDSSRCLSVFIEEFSRQSLGRIQVDSPYGAFSPYTVSSYVRHHNKIQTIQIEINSKLLYGDSSESNFRKVYIALKNIILRLQQMLGEPYEK